MKEKLLFLAIGVWFHAFAFGQDTWYQADDERIELFSNKKSILIYLDTTDFASSIFSSQALSSIEIKPSVVPSSYFFLNFDHEVHGDLKAMLGPLFAQPQTLLSAHHGYKTVDGMPLWLSKRLAYAPNASYDPYRMTSILLSFPSVQSGRTPQNIQFLELDDPLDVLELSQILSETGMFHWVHPDFFAPIAPMNDPLYADQFYLNNTGQTVDGGPGTPGIDINAPEAWALLSSNREVIVGVIDNGVEAHLDLQDTAGNSRLLSGYSAYSLTPSGGPYLNSEMHGQACAGIIASLHDNNSGIRGIIQDGLILPVYFPWVVSPTNVVEVANGIKWAYKNGAEVMNNSYGYPSCLSNPFPVLTDAIDSALTHGRGGLGTIMVFAAGNDTGCVRFPGNLSQTLTAGAIDKNGNISNYSNTGPEISVVAPSSANANSLGVRVTDRMGGNGVNFSGATDISDINYSRQFGGTSSATAQVTGVAALILKEAPYLTADTVMAIIKQTATDMGVVGFDTLFGHGRLNAFEALKAAQDTVLPVLWMELEARVENEGIWLSWEAVQEGGSHFEIWRNGRYLLEVPLSKKQTYSAWDRQTEPGTSVYQVVWVGINGERVPSASVEIFVEENGSINIQKNGGHWLVWGKGFEEGLGKLIIRDLNGKSIFEKRLDIQNGYFEQQMQASTFPFGLYFVEFTDAKGHGHRLKFVH